MTVASTDWRFLERRISGEVLRAGAPGYEAARKPAIARFHEVRPAAVVRCAAPADAAEAIAFARAAGLPLAVRSGGHCFAGRSSTGGIVIDVAPMAAVAMADGGVATIGAGARLGAVYDALDARRVTLPAGCGPGVGVSGLALGGGVGLLGRMYGLTSDALLGAEVVLADGRVVDCDTERHEDLFWALRGAGAGGFGVVTSLRFATLPAPAVATRLHVVWPVADVAAVTEAWQDWAPDGPDELAATLLVGQGGATVTGAFIGPEAEAARLVGELVERAAAQPASVLLDPGSYHAVKRALVGMGGVDDALAEGHAFSRSELFARPLPAAAIGALVEHLTAGGGAARELDLTPMGGAYNRVAEDATAFAHRGARFLLKHTTVVAPGAPAAERASARDWLERSFALVHPWGSGRVYPNFPEPDLAGWARAYHAGTYERLLEVKARYDPGDAFRGPQTIPAVARAQPRNG
jgi:FAD/FMN-containing dehydrogenase